MDKIGNEEKTLIKSKGCMIETLFEHPTKVKNHRTETLANFFF